MKANLFCIGLLVLLAGGSASATATADAPNATLWSSIGGNRAYAVEGSGDALAGNAEVTVESTTASPGGFGGAIARADAKPWRGRVVALSTVIHAMQGTKGSVLWLRVEGPDGSEGFINSAYNPVESAAPARREVRVLVPDDARELVFGLIINGSGKAVATSLHIGSADGAPGASPRDTALLEAAIRIVKDHALNADKVDWAHAGQLLSQFIRPDDGAAAAYPAIRALLARLGDGHSRLATPQQAEGLAGHARATTPPVIRSLDAGVGYILVPGFTGWDLVDSQAFTTSIVRRIPEVEAGAAHGWIIDLRENSGGNMWPMLAALVPFLGADTPLGAFRDRDGHDHAWTARTGNPGKIEAAPDLTASKVAVLVGGKTGSSGEAVYVAFRGRPRTRSFGQPTGGLSSANTPFPLPDGSKLILTTGIDVDRDGNPYGGTIVPDEVIDGRPGVDAALESAIAWLLDSEGGQPR